MAVSLVDRRPMPEVRSGPLRRRRRPSLDPMRIAALDLGSNSFHLLVVDARPDGTFVPLVREKEMIRLGDVVRRHGRVSDDAARRAVDAVRRFKTLADGIGATEIVACATSAIREADN